MHWRLKGLLQQALSLVPGGVAVNSLLQRTVGGRRDVAAVVKRPPFVEVGVRQS